MAVHSPDRKQMGERERGTERVREAERVRKRERIGSLQKKLLSAVNAACWELFLRVSFWNDEMLLCI